MKIQTKATLAGCLMLYRTWRHIRIASALGILLVASALLCGTGIPTAVLIAPVTVFAGSRYLERQYGAIASSTFDSVFAPYPRSM